MEIRLHDNSKVLTISDDERKVNELVKQAVNFRFAELTIKIQDGVLVSADLVKKIKFR